MMSIFLSLKKNRPWIEKRKLMIGSTAESLDLQVAVTKDRKGDKFIILILKNYYLI